MLALQVTAQQRDVLPAFEFAPDRAVQRYVDLGELERLLRVVDLGLAVEDALRDRVVEQAVEHGVRVGARLGRVGGGRRRRG